MSAVSNPVNVGTDGGPNVAAADPAPAVTPPQELASKGLPSNAPTGGSPVIPHPQRKRVSLAIAAAVFVALGCYFGIPVVRLALNTVSTDDAYVNSHVTFVAPRVPGQVVKVLVDDNYRVKQGDLLVQLDPEPYQVQLAIKEAALTTAKADVDVATAQVNSIVASARSSRFKLAHSMEVVKNQVALLQATVASLDSDLAVRERALKDLDRVKELQKTPGAISQQDVDVRLQDFQVAKAKVRQSLENIYQIRAGLGLISAPIKPDEITSAPAILGETPPDLEETFSTVRQSTAELMQALAPLGVHASSFDLTPRKIVDEFLRRDPDHNIDRIYAEIIKNAPQLQEAHAKVLTAQSDVDQAKLNLSYCNVVAEIDGVITRRNVNPGNNVQAGQTVMAIRSLTDIWIDANFKETQLADLRIGQPVKVETDVYGSHKEFEGRITGFNMGTGQTLALLPPQNATGNFVKIVQRLPVRIELNNYDPDKTPLFVGTSVTPYVYFREPLVGNDFGKGSALQPYRSPAENK